MEYQFYQQNNYYQPPVPDKRSRSMETASLVFGIISIATCSCIYAAIACGALAIIFALLSRGGEYTMGSMAKVGLALGIIGLIATIVVYVATYIAAINMYGSLEGILRAYCDMYGLDYEEVFGDVFSTMQ